MTGFIVGFLLNFLTLGGPYTTSINGPAVATQPAVRLESYPADGMPPATTIPQVTNTSGCRNLGTPTFTVIIPSISYSCPVYLGDDHTIDAGGVALMDRPAEQLSKSFDEIGTHWLAAHRSTFGSAFARVPDLADGASIFITNGVVAHEYVVVGRDHVQVGTNNGFVLDDSGVGTQAATADAVLRPDWGGTPVAPRLTLQTCDGPVDRWMIYADRIS